MILLDTSVAILIRDNDRPSIERLDSLPDDDVALPTITGVELENGVVRDLALAYRRRTRLDLMLQQFRVLEFTAECTAAYRAILEATGYSRRKVFDRMIAAQALVHRAPVVTTNTADFRDVPGLSLIDWS